MPHNILDRWVTQISNQKKTKASMNASHYWELNQSGGQTKVGIKWSQTKFNRSNIKCLNVLCCLNQYTALDSKYTGGDCPLPHTNEG